MPMIVLVFGASLASSSEERNKRRHASHEKCLAIARLALQKLLFYHDIMVLTV